MISLLLAILSLQFILVLCKKEQKSDDEAAGKHAAPVQSTYRRYTSPRQSIASRSGRNREQDAPSEAVTEYDNADKKTEQREISMNSSGHDLKNNA
ncbi:hypothetical protein PRIPAC_77195 [Pristionchus pacificus]|uniref:Uncharacterized protein n=1 Tax=Pristionchus pacificus TaxID=54126 RepID=A0A454XKY6_PRIPA|nr:hypothetical protein PRIPAC_77195 [Pristionchus pacificus]|eukprot:PDM70000.1 hypothetical protein PRIPAC_49212 [Pristionchus pacificus]